MRRVVRALTAGAPPKPHGRGDGGAAARQRGQLEGVAYVGAYSQKLFFELANILELYSLALSFAFISLSRLYL